MFNVSGRAVGFSLLLAAVLSASEAERPRQESAVTAEVNPDNPLCLRMSLKTGNATPSKLFKFRLPWGNSQSMVLAAVTPNGEPIERMFPVDDPPREEISVVPNAVLTGSFCLKYVFPKLEEAVKKSDVIVFWAYEAPEELGIPQWSGGWVLIRKQNPNSR